MADHARTPLLPPFPCLGTGAPRRWWRGCTRPAPRTRAARAAARGRARASTLAREGAAGKGVAACDADKAAKRAMAANLEVFEVMTALNASGVALAAVDREVRRTLALRTAPTRR